MEIVLTAKHRRQSNIRGTNTRKKTMRFSISPIGSFISATFNQASLLATYPAEGKNVLSIQKSEDARYWILVFLAIDPSTF